MFDFDKIIDRSGTDSVKYEGLEMFFGKKDLLPMWVADMDFACPPAVVNALTTRVNHPVYGYTLIPDSWYDSIINWNKRRHNWEIEKSRISFCPGIVPGLALLIDAITQPNDSILIQTPVYHPFYAVVKDQQRVLVENSLICNTDGYYEIDFHDLENKFSDGVKMMILCHPHNPVGRDWSEEELRRISDLCFTYHVILVSDEIHADLMISSRPHKVTDSIVSDHKPSIVTCMSASKTFNMGGLFTAYMVFNDEELKKDYDGIIARYHIYGNLFGIKALQAAYDGGEEWLTELLVYLRENITIVKNFLVENIPEVTFTVPEATYLLWLDFRKLNLSHEALKELIIDNAALALNSGVDFGDEGAGFMRMNIACPKAIILDSLQRLRKSIQKIV